MTEQRSMASGPPSARETQQQNAPPGNPGDSEPDDLVGHYDDPALSSEYEGDAD